ncbi:MAG: zinc ribbon domain-containing protein [Deltaproteobacteria bacterium]|jgi:hypothetical protein|nr:zinc ribbon domain-containing protein [Deltaproteobacteria bacterium]
MEPSCPKCNKPLPQVETIKYRFCPHCGAEIAAEPRRLDDAYLTIPPDPLPPQADSPPTDLNPQTEKKIGVTRRFNDQTIEPRPPVSRQQPKLTPPDTPPPDSFFRTRSAEKKPPIHTKEQTSPKKDVKKQSPTQKRNIIIAALIILALIILLLGGLFTF